MKKKLFKFAAGMAALCGLASTGAFAVAPPFVDDATTDIVYTSGATAMERLLVYQVVNYLCAGNIHGLNFTPPAVGAVPGTPPTDWGIACTASATSGFPAGNTLIFVKRGAGGSGYGVQPVARGVAIQMLNPLGLNAPNPPNPNVCVANGANRYDCPKADIVPDMGLSDADPSQFKGDNVPPGPASWSTNFTAADLANIQVRSLFAQSFGIVANLKLYQALQFVQFPKYDGSLTECNPSNAAYANNGNLEKCMPTISRDFVHSVMTGKVASWNGVNVGQIQGIVGGGSINAPAVTGTLPAAAAAYLPANPVANNAIRFCRRMNGSGTQTVANIAFLDNPCNSAALGPNRSTRTANIAGESPPLTTIGNGNGAFPPSSGSGDVEVCLRSYNNSVPANGVAPNETWNTIKIDNINAGDSIAEPLNTGGNGAWALGILSTDRTSGAQARTNTVPASNVIRYLKVDGVKPGIADVALGQHHYWGTLTCQYPNANVPGNTACNTLRTLSTPALAARFNTALAQHPWGVGGFAALPENLTGSFPPGNFVDSALAVNANPLIGSASLFSHATTAGSPANNCRRPNFYNSSGANGQSTNLTVPSSNFPSTTP